MKKINAVLSWVIMAILMVHISTALDFLRTGEGNSMILEMSAGLLAGTVALHVLVSVIIVFFLHDGTRISHYGRRNIRTILQRATGIVMVCLLHLHIKTFGFIFEQTLISTNFKIGIFITEMIYFGAIFLHIAVSFSKSFISLGLIRKEKTEKMINRVMAVLCTIMFLDVLAEIGIFLLKWK